jgi:hypothetical protein
LATASNWKFAHEKGSDQLKLPPWRIDCAPPDTTTMGASGWQLPSMFEKP